MSDSSTRTRSPENGKTREPSSDLPKTLRGGSEGVLIDPDHNVIRFGSPMESSS